MINPAEKILAQLQITLPDGTEQVHPIVTSPCNLGRTQGNDVVLPHQEVSRQHARLLFEGDQIQLIDLKSSNGTFVGERRLTPNVPHPISINDTFRIGPYVLCVRPAPAPIEPAPAPPAPILEAVPPAPEPAQPPAPMAESLPEPIKQAVLGTQDMAISSMPRPGVVKKNGGQTPPYEQVFGLREDVSRYLYYLPPLYQDHSFLGRFLLAFEAIWTPIEQAVDHFDLYLDPRTSPFYFLEHLASWVALTLDEKWPVGKQRQLVAEAAELYRRRGTRWALCRHIEIYAGVEPEIVEPVDHPHQFQVILRLGAGQSVDRDTVERIIQANQPAHTLYSLQIVAAGSGPLSAEEKST